MNQPLIEGKWKYRRRKIWPTKAEVGLRFKGQRGQKKKENLGLPREIAEDPTLRERHIKDMLFLNNTFYLGRVTAMVKYKRNVWLK